MEEDTVLSHEVSTPGAGQVSVLPALAQQLLQEAVLEVVEGQVDGQLLLAVELLTAETAGLHQHLDDALTTLTAGVRQR